MARKIIVSKEVLKLLVEDFQCKRTTVYYALRFKTNSPTARMIRKRAKEHGGVEWLTEDEIAPRVVVQTQAEAAQSAEEQSRNGLDMSRNTIEGSLHQKECRPRGEKEGMRCYGENKGLVIQQ